MDAAHLGLWYAWVPGVEGESGAYTVRGRGPEEAVAYVHALACVNGEIERNVETEVCARYAQEANAPLLKFTARLDGNESVIRKLE